MEMDLATGAGLPDTGQRANRMPGRRMHQAAVGLLTISMAAVYSGYALVLNNTFRTASYDLEIFDQAVRSYASFRPGTSMIKGLHNGFGPHFSVLGDHWSPIIASLAPLYWIHDSPVALLVAQAVLFALAIPPLWVFTRRAFGGGPGATAAAYLISVAYALSWPIATAAKAGFHEVAFAPVLIAVALERLQAGRLRQALIALAGLLLVKEDMGFLVAGLGVYLIFSRPRVVKRQALAGTALIIAGVADSVLATYLLIPAFGGRSDYYWAYGDLGPTVPQAAWHLVTHPASSLLLLVTPAVKLDTMLWLFGAFCFLPLLSPLSLATLPLLLERMLGSKFPNWWTTSHQYNAYLVIVLAFAAVDGAVRLERWARRARRYLAARAAPGDTAGMDQEGKPGNAAGPVGLACATAICGVAVCLVPRFPLGPALQPAFYQRNKEMKAAAMAVAAVPPGVTVEAVNELGPHLSPRDTVLLWDGDGYSPRYPPWVVANVAKREFTFSSVGEQRQRVALLERSGYQVVFKRRGYVVLRRAGSRAAGMPLTGQAQG